MNDKTVVLNAGLINYDENADCSKITSGVIIYDETLEDKILERINGSTIVIMKEMRVTGDIIRKFPGSVRMIREAGTGYNDIDLSAVCEKGTILCNIPVYNNERMTHTAIFMILNLVSSVQKQTRMLSEGNRDNLHKYLMVDHVEVNGKTSGVIGYGDIVREIVKVMQVLRVKILVTIRAPRTDVENIHSITDEEAFMQSDFISLNCPLSESTRHTINKKTSTTMKPTAHLVDTVRGILVDEKALVDTSQSNVITGAGLGVQKVGLLDDASPLYTMDNVIITPRVGWRGLETRQRLVLLTQDSTRIFSKGRPTNRVD